MTPVSGAAKPNADSRPSRWRAAFPGVLLLVVFLGARHSALNLPLIEIQSGRQIDTALMAREMARGSGTLLAPVLPVNGPVPSLLAAEFQLYPWLVSRLYLLFGEDVRLGRLLSLLFGAVTMLLMYRLLRRGFPERFAFFAGLLWCASPLLMAYNQTFQPDSLLLLLMAGAWTLLAEQGKRVSPSATVAGGALLALALLVKLPAGMMFPALLWARLGPGPERRWRQAGTLFGVMLLSLIPVAMWYRYTASFTGSSVNWGVFKHLRLSETAAFWVRADWWADLAGDWLWRLGPPGTGILVLWGAWRALRERRHEPMLAWLAGALAFYLASAWSLYRHDYYHLPVLPAFIWLAAIGLEDVFERARNSKVLVAGAGKSPAARQLLAVVVLDCLLTIGLAQPRFEGYLPSSRSERQWQQWNESQIRIGEQAAKLAAPDELLVTPSNISLLSSGLPGWVLLPDELTGERLDAYRPSGRLLVIVATPPRGAFERRYKLPDETQRLVAERGERIAAVENAELWRLR